MSVDEAVNEYHTPSVDPVGQLIGSIGPPPHVVPFVHEEPTDKFTAEPQEILVAGVHPPPPPPYEKKEKRHKIVPKRRYLNKT
tara:strand:+ start:953 stop:1201 length:249 start_codon:yes stop_codon:yes gene_type:complete